MQAVAYLAFAVGFDLLCGAVLPLPQTDAGAHVLPQSFILHTHHLEIHIAHKYALVNRQVLLHDCTVLVIVLGSPAGCRDLSVEMLL